ncbi:MAG: putative sugar nucleotidyl transferase [Candidatus Geothermarchaeota archaeon]
MNIPVMITDINCKSEYLAPLTLYRPPYEIRVGGLSLRERVEKLVGSEEVYLTVRSKLQGEILKKRLNVNVQEIPSAKEFLIVDSGLVTDFVTLQKLLIFLKNAPLGC